MPPARKRPAHLAERGSRVDQMVEDEGGHRDIETAGAKREAGGVPLAPSGIPARRTAASHAERGVESEGPPTTPTHHRRRRARSGAEVEHPPAVEGSGRRRRAAPRPTGRRPGSARGPMWCWPRRRRRGPTGSECRSLVHCADGSLALRARSQLGQTHGGAVQPPRQLGAAAERLLPAEQHDLAEQRQGAAGGRTRRRWPRRGVRARHGRRRWRPPSTAAAGPELMPRYHASSLVAGPPARDRPSRSGWSARRGDGPGCPSSSRRGRRSAASPRSPRPDGDGSATRSSTGPTAGWSTRGQLRPAVGGQARHQVREAPGPLRLEHAPAEELVAHRQRQQADRVVEAPESSVEGGHVVHEVQMHVEGNRIVALGQQRRRHVAHQQGAAPAVAPDSGHDRRPRCRRSPRARRRGVPTSTSSTGQQDRSPSMRAIQSRSGCIVLQDEGLAVDHDPLDARPRLAVAEVEPFAAGWPRRSGQQSRTPQVAITRPMIAGRLAAGLQPGLQPVCKPPG